MGKVHHIALQELQAHVLMLHRMAFCLSGKVVALNKIIVLPKLIYVMMVVQYLFFFPDYAK